MKKIFIFTLLIATISSSFALENKEANKNRKRQKRYNYSYIDRDHTLNETFAHIGIVYGLTWVSYPLFQPTAVKNHGSWKQYRQNFGTFVFDPDEPVWNWAIHPGTGSQLYLYYRANGYTRSASLGMAFISSTLFELTVEIYTEPASVQDLYQTPIWGSILGFGIEKISMILLNTGNPLGRFLGHLINPATLFWFYEGKIRIAPFYDGKNKRGLHLMAEF